MKKEDVYKKFFGFSTPTFYSWQREERPVIMFILKYFSQKEIEEFVDTGAVAKLDMLKSTIYYQHQNFAKFYFSICFNDYFQDNLIKFFDLLKKHRYAKDALEQLGREFFLESYPDFVHKIYNYADQGGGWTYLKSQQAQEFASFKSFLLEIDPKLISIFNISFSNFQDSLELCNQSQKELLFYIQKIGDLSNSWEFPPYHNIKDFCKKVDLEELQEIKLKITS